MATTGAVRPVILDFRPDVDRTTGRLIDRSDAVPSTAEELSQRVGSSRMRQAIVPAWEVGGQHRPADTRKAAADKEIIIDPIIDGANAARLRVGALTRDNVRAASQAVQEAMPAGSPSTLIAASTLHTLAAMDSQRPVREGRLVSGSGNGIPTSVVAPAATRTTASVNGGGSLFHAFQPQQPQPASNGYQPPPPQDDVPDVEVLFEFPGIGTQTTYYHAVLELAQVVVLCWKTGYRGTKYFPPSNTVKADPFAARVTGSPRVYRLHPTGLVIPFMGYELCVLLVEECVTENLPPAVVLEDAG